MSAQHVVVQLEIPLDGSLHDIDITLHGPYPEWTALKIRSTILEGPRIPGRVTVATTKKLPTVADGAGRQNEK